MKKAFCLLLVLTTLFSLNGIATASGYGTADDFYGYNEYGFPIRDLYEEDDEYLAGVREFKRQNYTGALQHFWQSAQRGYACGQYEYANCCENAWGCKKDYYIAYEYYFYAAEQGHATAQAALGRCYLWGRACELDYDTAVYYFQLSADQGDDIGELWLGYCYQNGYGVPKDRDEARYWYQQSAYQGNANAKKRLKSL